MIQTIRKIQPSDNIALKKVIRDVLLEHNVPKVGTAYADASLDCMFETYTKKDCIYFVVELNGKIIGGAGVAPLEEESLDTCELQKMYFLSEARGLGIGASVMEKCLQSARNFGFKNCYLETMTYMNDAQKLYKKYGFEYIDTRMGATGHSACPVLMLKKLRL
ncbi:MAG: GNAT family N-acetyltransferase [Flavobacterium sp. MedPE-SWcel]|uniref:GNAT family N-acetyltransferase n=1 Tax=uncultured Flavobacterium sp. TaxID=165435 RepID=UPI00091CE73A|nr:GNAT family N-acetyltransferase [uncultured Flavobacterium sp.]OIQ16286.1 MAG: GNAT family N-acetyltransferase [Flavobacterium sp. MedPE-SWcel]